jgi:hypothetical protein
MDEALTDTHTATATDTDTDTDTERVAAPSEEQAEPAGMADASEC